MKLLDTSVAVDHLRGTPTAVELLDRLLVEGHALVASEIVRFELLAGVRAEEAEVLELFCSSLEWLPVDEAIAREAARMARGHRKSHSGTDDADYLIAATAVVHGADLLTTNIRHFPMLPKLRAPY
ncbi:MAG TPA: type II toxin-antitoxin system VapC family toxin [Solirubrobacteraceae bacterium]|nr:type II toxin-antitoxin system VapC family toxin [Solirubrobacteraceae bacterium]